MGTDRQAVPRAAGRRTGKRRTSLRRYALVSAAVGVVAFFFFRERGLFTGFGAAIAHVSWYWVVAAFAVELASIPPMAEAQRMVLRAGGAELSRRQMNLIALASNAISASVPAGVAVSEGYSFARYRRLGAGTGVTAWAELAAGAIAFCALAALALLGTVIAGGGPEPVLLPLLAVVFAGSAGAAMLFRYPKLLVRAVDWLGARRPASRLLGGFGPAFRQAASSLTDVRPPMSLWLAAWGLSALNWLLDAACLALSFAAVHTPVPWGAALLALATAKAVTSIGLTPAGLGIAEGGLVGTLVAYGVAGAGAGAAVLIYRSLTLIGLVGIGWLGVARLAVVERRRAALPARTRLPADR